MARSTFTYSIPRRMPVRRLHERASGHFAIRSGVRAAASFLVRPQISISQIFSNFLKNFQIGPAFFVFTAILFVAFLSIITLVFSTRGVTKGYVLRDLESKRQVLLRQNEVALTQVAQVQALSDLVKSKKISHMIPARKITFMRGEIALASK